MKKIAYLAPDPARLQHVRSLLHEYADEVVFASGSLAKGVRAAKALMAKGVDIVIARGETADNIRDAIPELLVVSVPISGFDLVAALEAARKQSETIAVLSFSGMIRRVEHLESPFGVKILKYELPFQPSRECVNQYIDQALAAGVGVFVGGHTTREATRDRGLPYVPIPTSDEAYLETFFHARSLLKSIEHERARSGFIKGVLDVAYEGIVSIDREGYVTLINPVARKILKLGAEGKKREHIRDLWPELGLEAVLSSGREERDGLYDCKGVRILCNKSPIRSNREVIGAVATFQETDRIQTMESGIRKKIYAKGHVAHYSFGMILAADKKTRQVLDLAQSIAAADANVVIQGETGTGKEVFAQSIHHAGRRSNGPFVAVNCAALPASLLESELFGYMEGAFTGAKRGGKQGLFELAHGGTLFLDEIAEMDYTLQSRLLRVLQERSVMRLGGDRVLPVDVRVMAATHSDLKALVASAAFRQDLYYRINILNLHLPPLRERPRDIQLYAKTFLEQCAARSGRPLRLSSGALARLEKHDWPGNIRELQNMMERVAAMSKRQSISPAYLESLLHEVFSEEPAPLGRKQLQERDRLARVLDECEGDLDRAAGALGISRVTLWRRMKKYSLSRADYR